MPAYDVYMLKCATIIRHINKTEASINRLSIDAFMSETKGLVKNG